MKYAIVESGGKQYRAVEGDTLEVDHLPVEAGANVKLDQILLLADGETITVGTPLIKDYPVWTKVIEHFKGKKVTIFNYSPKKRIRVKTGHRQSYTRLLVEQIGGSEPVRQEPAKKVKKVVKAKAEAESANLQVEKPAEAETVSLKEKKPAEKTPAKTKKTSAPKVKAAPSKAVEKKPAVKRKSSPAKTTEKKPAKVAPKPTAKKPATKKPAATKK